jgi:hypothetical protein
MEARSGPHGSTGAHLDREAWSGAEEHVTASELNLNKEARPGSTGYVAAPEPTSTVRRGPGLQDTWRIQSPTLQGGVIHPFLLYFILFFVWKKYLHLCMHIIIGIKILHSTTTTLPFWRYLQLVSSLGVEDDHLVLCRRWGRSRTAPPNLLLLLRMNPAEYVHASEWTSAYER